MFLWGFAWNGSEGMGFVWIFVRPVVLLVVGLEGFFVWVCFVNGKEEGKEQENEDLNLSEERAQIIHIKPRALKEFSISVSGLRFRLAWAFSATEGWGFILILMYLDTTFGSRVYFVVWLPRKRKERKKHGKFEFRKSNAKLINLIDIAFGIALRVRTLAT